MMVETNKTLEFLYQETQIHFLINPDDKNVMINATEMAKAFGKRTTNYLANDKTKELIDELELTEKSVNSPAKILENRGHMGYYFCEILALDFAAWLDVKFKIWIYKTIKDLLAAKNKIVATAVSNRQAQIVLRNNLLKKAKEDGNKLAIELLQSERDIKHLDYLQRKALNEFKGQYEFDY